MLDELITKRDELFRRAVEEIPEVYGMLQTSGDRTEAREQEIYTLGDNINQGANTPKRSGHVVGCAFDCVWIDEAGEHRLPGPKIGALAESIGLRWGGGFKAKDPVHFDLGLDQIYAEWAKREARVKTDLGIA